MSAKRPHRRSGFQPKIQCWICSEAMNEQSYFDHLRVMHPGEQSNLRPLGQSSLNSFFGRQGRRPEAPNPTGAADRSRSPVQKQPEQQQSTSSVESQIAAGVSLPLSPHDDSQSPRDSQSRPSPRPSPHSRSSSIPSLTPSPVSRSQSPQSRTQSPHIRTESPHSPPSCNQSPSSRTLSPHGGPEILDENSNAPSLNDNEENESTRNFRAALKASQSTRLDNVRQFEAFVGDVNGSIDHILAKIGLEIPQPEEYAFDTIERKLGLISQFLSIEATVTTLDDSVKKLKK